MDFSVEGMSITINCSSATDLRNTLIKILALDSEKETKKTKRESKARVWKVALTACEACGKQVRYVKHHARMCPKNPERVLPGFIKAKKVEEKPTPFARTINLID